MQTDIRLFPQEIQKIIGSKPVEIDNVGRSGALVAFIGDELVLKRSEKGKLENAYLMQSFFHKNALAPEAVYYASQDYDYLVSRRAEGKSAIDPENRKHPKRLAHALGEFLLRIHSVDAASCPVKNVMDVQLQAFESAVTKNEGVYERVSSYVKIETISEACAIVQNALPDFQNDVVLHGDYCLPNIMLADFKGKHVIDTGEGGVGDRHFDLFWGLWSLAYNLKTDAMREEFLASYGKNRIHEDMITACGCLCLPI